MAAGDSPDWLPAGWTVLSNVLRSGRQTRCYRNLKTGKTCFSKDDVMQCIKMGSTGNDILQPTNTPTQRRAEKNHMQLVVKQNEYPHWLPDGWIMELKTRRSGSKIGHNYKVFIHPLTGCKFYSKPEVFQYLKSLKQKSYPSEQKKTDIKLSAGKVVIERCRDEKIPSGWVKEIRITKNKTGIRKDPFYTDPVSGYVFRSRKEIMRYLETGEITKYTLKLKEKQTRDRKLMNGKSSSLSSAKRNKVNRPATNQQRSAGSGSFDSANSVTPKSGDSKRRRNKRLRSFKDILDTKEIAVEESGENSEAINLRRSPLPSPLPKAGGSKKQQGKRASKESLDAKESTSKECAGSEEIITATKSARSSARGSKENQEKKDATDGPLSTPDANTQQDDLLESRSEKNSQAKTQDGEKKSKSKKAINLPLPRRSSSRLAGVEPELAVNTMFSGLSVNDDNRDLHKSEDTVPVSVARRSLVDGVTKQHNLRSGNKRAYQKCKNTDTPHRKVSNKRKKPLEEDRACEKQLLQVEAGITEGERAEAHPASAFGEASTVPCLKTPIGAVPVKDTVDMGCLSTPVADVLQDTGLVGKRSYKKRKFNSGELMNSDEPNFRKKFRRRLIGLEHEPVANPSSDAAPTVECTRPNRDLVPDPSSRPDCLEDEANQQIKAPQYTGLAQHVSTATNSCSHVDQLNKGKKSLEDPSVTLEPLQKLESEKTDNGKTEPLSSFPFRDFWSDPCLEFAFKTLTGAITIETAIQSSFQQQYDSSHGKKDSGPSLPDFGSPSCFQKDISPLFDAPEKPSTQKQVLPPSNVSLPACSAARPNNHHAWK